jgi:predicted dehydrogenase
VLKVFNATAPHMAYRMTVTSDGGKRRVRVDGEKKATYTYQLEAFRDAVVRGAPTLTPPSDSIANMRAIDAVYDAAGLPRRRPST